MDTSARTKWMARPAWRVDRAQLRRFAASMLAGAGLAAAFPPYGAPSLLPLALAGLLLAMRGASPRHAFYCGFGAGLVCFGATVFWLFSLFGPPAISLIAIMAAFTGLFCASLSKVRARFARLPVWAAAPILWVAVEYYRSELFWLNFGWMGLGYGAIGRGAAGAAAASVGSYGISLGIVALGACMASLAARRRYAACLVPLAAWAAFLSVPVAAPPASRPLRVRLVQAPAGDEDTLFELSGRPGREDVVLWPEYSLLTDPARDARLAARLAHLARSRRAVFVFGAKAEIDPANEASFRNTAYVLGPDGRELGRHVKNHTVHFFQDGVRGRLARAIPAPLGRLGVGICFDMDYPDVARRLAQSGAEVLVIPNMDPAEWGSVQRSQHRLMFQMRAAECGRWLARADVAGGTSVAAPDGREVARVGSGEPAVLDAVVGRERALTPYVRGGWVLGPASLIAALLLVGAALVRGRRAEAAPPR